VAVEETENRSPRERLAPLLVQKKSSDRKKSNRQGEKTKTPAQIIRIGLREYVSVLMDLLMR
jgi:hypothetical protein